MMQRFAGTPGKSGIPMPYAGVARYSVRWILPTKRFRAAEARIAPRDAVQKPRGFLWHLRGILEILLLFLILSIAMYLVGGTVNASMRPRSSMSQTFYFCAGTALTIG
ncbi:hypothetical protein ABH945_004494 [Paraburkholderia sp. GAS333]|uniref:hypothetical protein n=1 Tax=Paraburkholderia sp. GAS333 TaxID=3156279 RepID=UPI003D1AF444